MALSELMKNYKPVYPEGGEWVETIECFQMDNYDMKIIEDLMDDYRNNGEWREPIVLVEDELGGWVANGTHRTVAAMMMELDTVYCHLGRIQREDDLFFYYVNVSDRNGLADSEDVYYSIRSLRYDKNNWLETDGGILLENGTSFYYYSHSAPELNSQKIKAFLEEHLQKVFPESDFEVSVGDPELFED